MSAEIIYVENIKCGGCANSIKKGLEKINEQVKISVDIEEGKVSLESKGQIPVDTYVKALHNMGYPVPGEGNMLKTAQSYVSCMIGRMTPEANS